MAIARFLHAGFCDPRTEILSVQQWTPERAERISRADLVIFLDASVWLPPGEIHLQSVAPAMARPGALTHSLTPAGLLGLANQLYEKVPERAFLLTVGGESFEQPERLSYPVRRAIPAAHTNQGATFGSIVAPGEISIAISLIAAPRRCGGGPRVCYRLVSRHVLTTD